MITRNNDGLLVLNSNGNIDSSSLGYQYTIQTTTQIRDRVIDQVFYEVPFSMLIPVDVGLGAWMEDIKTNTVFNLAGDFFDGVSSLNSSNAQMPVVEVGTAPITAKIASWTMAYNYTVAEVNKALASNNWDVIESKMKALKKRWDLGLQQVAFMGDPRDAVNYPGLFTNSVSTIDTATIPVLINSMNPTQFAAFVATIMDSYFQNSNNTRLPDTFLMGYKDWLGLQTPVSASYPNIPMITYLLDAFRGVTGNANFVIAPVAYLDATNQYNINQLGGVQRYALYRNDPEVVKMDIPVDFMLNPAGTANNWQWQAVSFGQYTGAVPYRVAELEYFDLP